MAYSLGPVKPWVTTAANEIGPKFGIRIIYGFGPGSVINSDHPKGLALDFMTSSKLVGDALSAYVVANAQRLGVKYVIWWYRIWTPQQGWHTYTGTPNPHIDHVHVSFNAVSPGSQGLGSATGDTSGTVSGNSLAVTPVGIGISVNRINEIIEYLKNPHTWQRVGLGGLGTMLIVLGVGSIVWQTSIGEATIKTVGKVI